MTKCLVLMRHAEALVDYLVEDFDRDLTQKGYEQSKNSGIFLKNHIGQINKVLCSPSKRTYQTYKMINHFISIKNLELVPKIYNESKEFLLNLLMNQEDENDNLMLIGHNPSISELSFNILKNYINDFELLSPSMLIIIVFSNLKSWSQLSDAKILKCYSNYKFKN
jgi:phosphohistidine phosphatase